MSETQDQKGYALSLEHLSNERLEVSNLQVVKRSLKAQKRSRHFS